MSVTHLKRDKFISSVPHAAQPSLFAGAPLQAERPLSIATINGFLQSPLTANDLTTLSVSAVTSVAGLVALRADYERLQSLTRNPLPFALHEWHVTWCEHFLELSWPMQAQPMVYTIRQASGVCVAIVPMILTRRTVGPFVFGALDMLGPDPALTEIRTALIEPGCEARVAQALQAHVGAERGWDWIRWSGLDATFGKALSETADLKWNEPLLAYLLDLPATWELFHAGLKRNIRESLRHCYNSLKRDSLEFSLVIAQEPADAKAAVARFLELHAMRATLAETVAHANRFAGTSVQRFLHAVCARLAERGVLRVFQLQIGNEIVASRIGFVVGDSLYLYYSGFDPAWAKYGVMTTTLAEAIKYAIAQGLATVNLSTGTDVSKTRWGPRAVPYGDAVQIGKPLSSRMAYSIYHSVRTCRPMESWLGRFLRRGKRSWN